MAGLAQLRSGVDTNCIMMAPPEACIFPLVESAYYMDRTGALRAVESFRAVLDSGAQIPGYMMKARFFLNLSHMVVGQYPDSVSSAYLLAPELFASPRDPGRFRNVAPSVGMNTLNHAGGIAMEDFDGDGFLDIFTTSSWLDEPARYFRNNGDGTFSDRSEEAGLAGQVGGLNLVHADYDGDGHEDVLILRGGWLMEWGRQPRSLLRNDGTGVFTDVTREAGLGGADYPSQTAAFADYDLDGDLDLYIGNEADDTGKRHYPSQLFRNQGDGSFTDVAKSAGVENFRFAKGVAWGDFDGDRDPDLFVSNHMGDNRLYRNNGDGSFDDIASEAGVLGPTNSFPAWFWDYDNDGLLDLFVASYGGGGNRVFRSYLRPGLGLGENGLYRNNGDGSFTNRGKEAGLMTLTLTMGANFGDIDNDGYPDFYLGTGTPAFDSIMPNVLYWNDGRGGFTDATEAAGMGNLQKGHGIAFGDIDNDGDQDVFAQVGGFYRFDPFFNCLFVNPGHDHHWITVRLTGVKSNRSGVGSRISVTVRDEGVLREIHQWIGPTGSFGSSSRQAEIGLGSAAEIVRLSVYWPASDTTQDFASVPMDRVYRVTEFSDELKRVENRPFGL
ncbi:MAG: hypothetical protein CME07_05880 [Gemmatimonadetes bacterium]|nr:hypothetical protein [Gemmatimonadota bacterium]